MKRLFSTFLFAVSTALLCSGCLALQVGGGDKKCEQKASVGQQLIDLKTARDVGAITEAEYQTQKAKLLRDK